MRGQTARRDCLLLDQKINGVVVFLGSVSASSRLESINWSPEILGHIMEVYTASNSQAMNIMTPSLG